MAHGRAGDASGEGPASLLSNGQIAKVLAEIADMLEVKGESGFKVNAYRRAAESVARCPVEVGTAYRAGRPPQLPGVGSTISDRIAELARDGRLQYHEKLREEVPPTLLSLLAIPGVGPRTAGEAWRELGVATVEDLEAATREGRLRRLRGFSPRSEARILEGIAELARRPPRRMRMGEAHRTAERVVAIIKALPGAVSVTAAGSVRRWRETVGDLDVLVETDDPDALIAALVASPEVERVGGHGGRTGRDRTTVQLWYGPQLDVMTMPTGQAGAYLVHFTGSAEHNVRLRHLARQRGWSLSEHGLTRLPADLGDESSPGTEEARSDADRLGDRSTPAAYGGSLPSDVVPEVRTFATEAEVYAALGLQLVPPELREDRGEVEAAASNALPELVRREDLRGDCHSHSDWSDGREPLEVMVESARRLGHEYLVLTDHSQSLAIAKGLTPERVAQQQRVIGELNERFAAELARGELPAGAHPGGFRLLHGCELEITSDGRLDYDDTLLATFDVVVASLHVGRRQPRRQLMARYETAMRSPHVDIISHPSGRKIDLRPDLDLDWEAFFRMAAETGTLLEVNGSDARLDLDEHRVRAALQAGCRFTIDSDAHDRGEWQNLVWGTAIARRGWLEAAHVANTLPLDRFLALMGEKPHRA